MEGGREGGKEGVDEGGKLIYECHSNPPSLPSSALPFFLPLFTASAHFRGARQSAGRHGPARVRI